MGFLPPSLEGFLFVLCWVVTVDAPYGTGEGKSSRSVLRNTLQFVIRTQDNRRPVGDYFAGQLELLGFTVEPLYKNHTEEYEIWVVDEIALSPRIGGLTVASDLAGGPAGSYLW
jgi:hypothetical protein